jgi:hypothetical protein
MRTQKVGRTIDHVQPAKSEFDTYIGLEVLEEKIQQKAFSLAEWA